MNIFPGQLWKLTTDGKLENQNGKWLYSSKRWQVPEEKKRGSIKDQTTDKVLSVFSYMMVDLQDEQDLLASEAQGKWMRGKADSNDWFKFGIRTRYNEKYLCAGSNSRVFIVGMYFFLIFSHFFICFIIKSYFFKDDFSKDGSDDSSGSSSDSDPDDGSRHETVENFGLDKKNEILTIKTFLKHSRKEKWNERFERIELKELLRKDTANPKEIDTAESQDVRDGLAESNPHDKKRKTSFFETKLDPIYKLQTDSNLNFDDIMNHCTKLGAMGPLITWGVANDAFVNLSEAFEWSCLNGKDVLTEYFVNQS